MYHKLIITIALSIVIFISNAAPLIVSGGVTNISSNNQYDYIEITNGGVLNIQNCTILISQAEFITVNTGCKLTVYNSVIDVITGGGTSADYWGGVKVYGINNLIQTEANQGTFELMNNSILKNALTAVSVGNLKYTDLTDKIDVVNWWNKGGGIIKAEDSKIVNCRYGAVFSPYYNSTLTRPNANLSYFKNTTFEWNNDAQGNLIRGSALVDFSNKWAFKTLVELNEVHDISFIGLLLKIPKNLRSGGLTLTELCFHNQVYVEALVSDQMAHHSLLEIMAIVLHFKVAVNA